MILEPFSAHQMTAEAINGTFEAQRKQIATLEDALREVTENIPMYRSYRRELERADMWEWVARDMASAYAENYGSAVGVINEHRANYGRMLAGEDGTQDVQFGEEL